jgi:sarcosine oxidase subunit gamma
MLKINEATIARAWNVQGDAQRLGLALPIAPNTVARSASDTAMWLGPQSWLVFADRVDVQDGAVFDVSASRVGWRLEGAPAASVLAKHCALDLARFAPGSCAQGLFGQVNALYYRHANRDAFTLFVARSFGQDALHHLETSAAQYGYEMVAARPFIAD